MKKMQNGGDTRPVQNTPKVTISPSSSFSKTPVKKTPTKKATPPRGTMDLIRGSKKSDYEGTVTLAAKKGGAVKKYQDGGRTISEKAAARKVAKGKGTISKSYPSGPEEKGSYVGYSKEARKSDGPWKSMKDSKPARPIMKTGGMVNSNAKVSASKVAKGKVGGMSTAPKTAVPKAKYGMSMRRK